MTDEGNLFGVGIALLGGLVVLQGVKKIAEEIHSDKNSEEKPQKSRKEGCSAAGCARFSSARRAGSRTRCAP